MQPKLIGYLCKSGAYALHETGHAGLRKMPQGFQAFPVLHLQQVGRVEIAKAFRLGAAGVLLMGCEACSTAPQRERLVQNHLELLRAVAQWGGSAERLILAWHTASRPEEYFETVAKVMARVQSLPPLRLPDLFDEKIAYCG